MENFFNWLRYWVDMLIEMFNNTQEWLEKAFPGEEEAEPSTEA